MPQVPPCPAHPPHPLSTPPDPHSRKDTMPAPGPLFCRFSNSKLRLMCAVRTAVARAFDAKLIVGLGGRCCKKIRAWNPGTAEGKGVCPICRTPHGLHAACRTAVSRAPFLPHVPRPTSQVLEPEHKA